jgi:hypothetical protein
MNREHDDTGLNWWSAEQAASTLAEVGYAPLEALREPTEHRPTIIEAPYERLDNEECVLPDPTEEGFSQLRRSVSEMLEYCGLLDEHTRLRLSRQAREIDLFWTDENQPVEALRHRFRRAVIHSDPQADKLFELIKNDEDDMLISVYLGFCFGFSDQSRERLENLIERSDHAGFINALAQAVLEKEPELFEIDRDIRTMADLAETARIA